MMFGSKIKQLREELRLPQRVVASALELDTPMYSRIELGRRTAKRQQIPIIAKVLKYNETELAALWLADKIVAAIGEEKELAGKAFKVVEQKIKIVYDNSR
ncbi:MAG: helix-turn-helix domain-containing protein [Dysgonamonadaceae bacterium]|jgi:transcriptional regulator with XRE-family HTH domain|nr:helix-turn-helix domain-containing protein [Dysgonamonadaceae bacterium]